MSFFDELELVGGEIKYGSWYLLEVSLYISIFSITVILNFFDETIFMNICCNRKTV